MYKAVEEREMRITKDAILELINIYQMISERLQDVQNSITYKNCDSTLPASQVCDSSTKSFTLLLVFVTVMQSIRTKIIPNKLLIFRIS